MRYISILLLFLTTTIFANQTSVPGTKGLRFPSISPDGESVAFVYKSDIWKANIKSGQAERITTHPELDTRPIWSPDGQWIAFASKRGGDFNVWVISHNGGEPRQITWDGSWDSPCTWSKDSKTLYFCSYRDGKPNIWKIPVLGGFVEQVTFDGGRHATFSEDEKDMVYANGSVTLWQQGYRGSSNWDLYLQKNGAKSSAPITDFAGNDIRPIMVKDEIFFLRESLQEKEKKEVAVYNIWKMKMGEFTPTAVTNVSIDIHSMDISSDAKFCIFEMNFVLWKLNLDGSAGPERITIDIQEKQYDTKTKKINITSGNEMGHWSPDGRYIAFAMEGELYIMNSSGGQAQQITSSDEKEEWPRFSPDGKLIAYCVSKDGNSDIFLYDIAKKKHKRVTNHASNDFYHSWSPDGKYLVFTSERSGNRDIWKVHLEDGVTQQVTHGKKSEDDAVYSPDGRWIAFDSGETGNQEIWVMPADGVYKDARQITKHNNLTQVASWSADSNWLVYETHVDDKSFIRLISRSGGESMLVAEDASVPCWSPLGDKILFESRREGAVNIYTIDAPQRVVSRKRIPFLVEREISELSEKKQVFDQALDFIERGFYDKELHGKDWKELGKLYRSLAMDSTTDEEMYFYMNRLLGELEASHLGINKDTKALVKTGELGWTLQHIPGQKGCRVIEVIKDGPADKAWIREGDFVFQIEDKILSEEVNLSKILNDKIGKSIRIFVSSRYNVEDGRYLKLKPVSARKIMTLKYNELLRKRMSMVRERCHNKVLYLHLREMSANTLEQFREVMQRYSDSAEGMIMDLRDNVGGNIHQQLISILQQKPYISAQTREGKPQSQPAVYWGKPIVVIINENSFSDAEVFTHAFKELKLGEVVGVPTSGGVIGTRDVRLANGASFRVPIVGYYTTEGKNMEGLGVQPDYVVKETSQDRLEGKDPQLDFAINLILKQLKGK